ncbi:hypothetical protein [Cetobacterium sp.]|uniref:hypothetical protein n=1 Tax=Cetobacterium sp. TaxID=2071632 RepID=UPI003EE584E6
MQKQSSLHQKIFCVIFLVMTVLNALNIIEIPVYGIYSLTLGALFICISTCCKSNRIKIGWYSFGIGVMTVGVYIKSNDFINVLIDKIDSNTLMLLSLSVTFASLIVANISVEKQRNRVDKYAEDLGAIKRRLEKSFGNELDDITIQEIKEFLKRKKWRERSNLDVSS